MRLAAYKDAIKQAKRLPESIPTLSSYFKEHYSPQASAINFILKKARLDTLYLHASELEALYNHAKEE